MRKNVILLIIVVVSNLTLFSQIEVLDNQFSQNQEKISIDYRIDYDNSIINFEFSVQQNYHITSQSNGFFWVKVKDNEYLKIENIVYPKGVDYKGEEVFRGDVNLKVIVKQLKDIKEPVEVTFITGYQLCLESHREECYLPKEKEISVKIEKNFVSKKENVNKDIKKEKLGFGKWVEKTIKTELNKKSFLLFVLVFIAGFLTSLTPCVYPVIPIIMGYIGSRSEGKKLKGFYLSLFFVLGLSLIYSVLGVIAAKTGSIFGVSFQNPVIVIIISAIFILMGLSLAGLFEIPVPSSIASKVQGGYKNEILGSMIIGGVAGIIAAPCVGPVLIALLTWISQTGNIFLGFILTFIFSLGMGVIFVLAGTFSGIISSMPRGGKWMEYIKYFFAIIIVAAGIYFLTTITTAWLTNVLWGIFLITIGYLFFTEEEGRITKLVMLLILLIGIFLFYKGLDNLFSPEKSKKDVVTSEIKTIGESINDNKVKEEGMVWYDNLEKGMELAKKENKFIIIDNYADWCVACKELEKFTFPKKEVQKILKKNFIAVKLDFTEKNDKNEKIKKKLGILGLPTIIFMNKEGKEIDRFSGFLDKDDFIDFVNDVIESN